QIRTAVDITDQAKADQGAQHQCFALTKIERSGSSKRKLIAKRDHRVDHAERDTADDQLEQDFHYFTRETTLHYRCRQQAVPRKRPVPALQGLARFIAIPLTSSTQR